MRDYLFVVEKNSDVIFSENPRNTCPNSDVRLRHVISPKVYGGTKTVKRNKYDISIITALTLVLNRNSITTWKSIDIPTLL